MENQATEEVNKDGDVPRIVRRIDVDYEEITASTGTDEASGMAARDSRIHDTEERFVMAVTNNILLQLWEGTVLGFEKDEFTAVLRDKTDENQPDEEVTLATDEIDPEDVKLLRPGAVFYWSVRYEQGPGVPRRRVSRIRFRRIPGWTASEIHKARSIGKDIKAIWSSNAQDSTHD